MDFETKVYGKWILAGEHSVLRGAPALVFPLTSRYLQLNYQANPKSDQLTLELDGSHGEELQLLFWGVLEKACEIKKIRRNQLTGKLKLQSSIPVGAGLGASAALSVAVARWFHWQKIIQAEEIYEFSRQLENLFHGESSGVDIAVAMSGRGLKFVRNGEKTEFVPKWQPKWYVSYSGKRGVTVECVNKVKDFVSKNNNQAEKLDTRMKQAVEKSQLALSLSEKEGFLLLCDAVKMANKCFTEWGLTDGVPKQHLEWLTDSGAEAVKPTGSGNGGYVLSLWRDEPPAEVLKKLIPC